MGRGWRPVQGWQEIAGTSGAGWDKSCSRSSQRPAVCPEGHAAGASTSEPPNCQSSVDRVKKATSGAGAHPPRAGRSTTAIWTPRFSEEGKTGLSSSLAMATGDSDCALTGRQHALHERIILGPKRGKQPRAWKVEHPWAVLGFNRQSLKSSPSGPLSGDFNRPARRSTQGGTGHQGATETRICRGSDRLVDPIPECEGPTGFTA